MIRPEAALRAIAAGHFWVDADLNPVEPVEGDRFCMFYLVDSMDADNVAVRDGSLVEYVGEGRVVSDNCDDECKDDYAPGGQFEELAVRQA